ncbi:MAG: thioredoxin domain-containing protein [Devosia sp.]|uniref:DsbA family protein n=1 Tax=Devosia sp. TaxID=1871048 RepID=UPI001AC5CCD2|nr:thioredoxin domain-containing protein [Devosia sp.]MBN9318032.1 thioredoxin domain-containing protein [Devosia sp.]
MNRRHFVLGVTGFAIVAYTGGAFAYREAVASAARDRATKVGAALYRDHAPIIGPTEAKVTITEFFDPSCEACRAFYPIVKQIMELHAGKVRLVLRYAALHEGSDQVVRILEAGRLQDKFIPVLEALLAKQPEWAVHGAPDIEKAWSIAGSAGLDLNKARTDAQTDPVTAVLAQDAADVEAVGLTQTPTFFVNGKPLTDFGPQQLYDLVTAEVQGAGA